MCRKSVRTNANDGERERERDRNEEGGGKRGLSTVISVSALEK